MRRELRTEVTFFLQLNLAGFIPALGLPYFIYLEQVTGPPLPRGREIHGDVRTRGRESSGAIFKAA